MLNKVTIDDITYDLMPKTEIKPADLLIVFGTTYGIDLFVKNIADLYKNGLLKKYILCTGGNSFLYKNNQCIESNLMKNLLVKNDIPESMILVENKSKNTGENLQFSIPILQQAFGEIENIKSIIGVGKIHATLRFLMTMCKYFPKQEKMFYPINVFGENDKLLEEKLAIEAEKIPEYLQKGFIAPLDGKVLIS